MQATRPDHSLARTSLRLGWLVLGAVLLLAATLVAGTAIGETRIPFSTVWQVLANKWLGAGYELDAIDQGIVWNYRLTRAMVAMSCGAALALAGVLLQTLLRNALADPYLLGISAGASTGAVLVAVAGVGGGVLSMTTGAFGGAVLAFVLVLALAHAAGGGGLQNSAQIVLAGIAGSQLFNALTSLIVTKSGSAEQARGIMFWLLGSLSGARWPSVWLTLTAAVLTVLVCLWHARALDAFSFGAESAAALGVPVRRVQITLLLVAALATAVMVSVCGAIGFVGLVIPHVARLLVGVRHHRLLPASALLGAVFLVAADVLARVLIPGQVLPIGVITALVGAPLFGLMLLRQRRGRHA